MGEWKPKFQVGDRVLVTGDEANWDHPIEPDTEVEIIDIWTPADKKYDTVLPGYRVTTKVGEEVNPYDWDSIWDVAEMDLRPPWTPPTDEELAEVYASLGVKETP